MPLISVQYLNTGSTYLFMWETDEGHFLIANDNHYIKVCGEINLTLIS